jgi:hypothetical protein
MTKRIIFGIALLMGAVGAQAQVLDGVRFFNIQVGGTLAQGATFQISQNNTIDFHFPNGSVGDGQAQRSGTITITYDAQSNRPLVMNRMHIGIMGQLSGSGRIDFQELIEDMERGGYIGQHQAVLTHQSNLPYTNSIDFSRQSHHIRVKKTFSLSAIPDTPGFDIARISLNEQTIEAVPEPASLAALALGAGLIARRRRRK